MNAEMTEDLALVTGLYRATNAAVRELDQRLMREHDVTFVQAVTLLAIDTFDRPQPHLVAEHLSQQSQTVTGVLDRLERAGHVTRRRDLDDRRAVRLELTESGRVLVDEMSESLKKHITDVLDGVKPRTREKLIHQLDELEHSIRTAR
ncbi:MAG TPA: MarR family winged helix-turn-helix transcriptional regulator [Tepidiformaceae bacterium]|nr:MarR family winged helix-turn-helix transcriptional regulator [Tepidiformaceae bacterium]HMO95447.1 MarR family winged helix-turn-helix transcriptional regulator [Tepidiformaceae bacterium]